VDRELQKSVVAIMNRAFSAILVSGLLLASTSSCSSASAERHGSPSVTLSVSPGTVTPTGDVLVTVHAAANRVHATAMQWTFRYDGNLMSIVSFAAAPKSLTAKKTIACANQEDGTRCILWGSNTQPIPDGDIAEAKFRLRVGSQIPKAAITLDHSEAVSSQGQSLVVVPAFSTITIVNPTSTRAASKPSHPKTEPPRA
jgi:hypothetical protein